MIEILFNIVCVVCLVMGVIPITMFWKFKRYCQQKSNLLHHNPIRPQVEVIMPCKGVDVEFESNLESILNQKDVNYSIRFVVATLDDSAFAVLEKIQQRYSGKVQLSVAGVEGGRGQKMTNTLKGLSLLNSQTEIVVFLDSDISIHRDFLKSLIEPLSNPGIGATAGYHVFLPVSGSLSSCMRTVWGLGGTLTLADMKRNFAIGAATAMRVATLKHLDIEGKLKKSLSDTFTITNTVRSQKLQIYFVPRCLFFTLDQSTWQELMSWSNRLTVLSKAYSPAFWRMVAFNYSTQALFFLFLPASFILSSFRWLIPLALLCALNLLISVLVLDFVAQLTKADYPDETHRLLQYRLKIYLLSPVTSILFFINVFNSVFSKIVVWRGVKYRVNSAESIEVLP